MTIIECETMPDAVKLPHVTYTIGVGETVEDCIRKFERRFGVEPVKAYHWGVFVYCEKP